MEPSGNFVLEMARAVNPLPSAGFSVKRGPGHVVTRNLPKLVEFMTKRTSAKIGSQLPPKTVALLKRRLLQQQVTQLNIIRLALATQAGSIAKTDIFETEASSSSASEARERYTVAGKDK